MIERDYLISMYFNWTKTLNVVCLYVIVESSEDEMMDDLDMMMVHSESEVCLHL